MKQIVCLSLTQPWATLMAIRAKCIETRSWRTSYTGLVAIHASKSYPKWAKDYAENEEFSEALDEACIDANELPLGCILAVGQLVMCRPTEVLQYAISDEEQAFGDYTPGRWAWVFEQVCSLPEPVPVRGSLGLWKPEPALAKHLVDFYRTGVVR